VPFFGVAVKVEANESVAISAKAVNKMLFRIRAMLRVKQRAHPGGEIYFREPLMGALFMASSACTGMTTKKVWSYALAELNGITKVTVQPVWEYPDDYCKTQTQELIWSQREEIAAFQAMLDKAPTSSAQVPTPAPTSVSDQQQDTKRHAACLELARDNPSIT
jgi:hypothetical protein